MNIDNAVHALIDNIIHHLLDSVEPLIADLVVGIEVWIPRYGYANGIETGHFHHFHDARLGYRLPFRCLKGLDGGKGLFVSIERVPQVPAHFHVPHGLGCGFKLGLCLRG